MPIVTTVYDSELVVRSLDSTRCVAILHRNPINTLGVVVPRGSEAKGTTPHHVSASGPVLRIHRSNVIEAEGTDYGYSMRTSRVGWTCRCVGDTNTHLHLSNICVFVQGHHVSLRG